MKIAPALYLAIAALLLPQVSGAGECFPGADRVAKSPSGKYAVEWSEPARESDEHHLFLSSKGKRSELLAFPRAACVYWSPGEEFLAVTNNSNSNTAETYIYGVGGTSGRRDVARALPASIQEQLRHSSHGYVKALRWDAAGLAIHVWGDSLRSNTPFDFNVVCTVTVASVLCEPGKGANQSLSPTPETLAPLHAAAAARAS